MIERKWQPQRLLVIILAVIVIFLIMKIFKGKKMKNLNENHLEHLHFPSHLEKIDWHDYKLIQEESNRVGLGEHGFPVRLNLTKDEAVIEREIYLSNGFNGALSDKIALNRSLPDVRHPKCTQKRYLATLPSVSVIVSFHDEHLSTLLRTVHSVLLRSPKSLIKEIFLVDDGSNKHFLKKELDVYVQKYLPKVTVIRLNKRRGLMAARIAGAQQATADVLVFLDSHTEANINWLPPLLEPIALSPRTVTCPFIDFIDNETFDYRPQKPGRGAFNWKFNYVRLPALSRDMQNLPEPFQSPVMCGGLFAISREFFWELGGYDPGLDIWGGEQYELSFKIWQCGGYMVDVPCSRVGHVYRKSRPRRDYRRGDIKGRNYRRVAEVWMDEYAQYIYMRHPRYLNIDPGDITHQKALRQKLKCKPFRWFMTQIAFDLPNQYPPIPPEPFGQGRVRPVSNPEMCLDAHHGDEVDKIHIKQCTGLSNVEQDFIFTRYKDVRSKTREICWKLFENLVRTPIRLYRCVVGNSKQVWRYHSSTKQILHGGRRDARLCVDWEPGAREVFVNLCNSSKVTQQWIIDSVNKKRLADWYSTPAPVTGPLEYP